LGGLRVTLYKDELGIFHACLAQTFLCLVLAIAIFLSRWWRGVMAADDDASVDAAVVSKGVVAAITLLVFGQLALGATMRHQHAGLAVPDFPLAYGKVFPATDAASLERYNQQRHDHREFNDITAAHIYVHMAHRFAAYAILAAISWWWLQSRKRAVGERVRSLSTWWLSLVWLQAVLGVVTVLKNKPADIATAHVLVGAMTLATGVWMTLILAKFASERKVAAVAEPAGQLAEARG
jgi:heme a synthase